MSLRKNFGIFAFACASAVLPLAAQTPPTTCTVAPASITNLSIEGVLSLTNSLTTLTPTVDPAVLAAITSGAQEIRTRFIYNPVANTVTNTTFLVAAGSPNPTPLGVDVTQSQVNTYTLSVDKVYTSCKPMPSVMFVGVISSSSNGPFGSDLGSPAAISIGYTTDTPPKINNLAELLAGRLVAYYPSANGTLTFPPPPPPPPTSNGAPTIVLNPVPPTSGSIQVFFNPFAVSASGSTDPANLALTYAWTSDKPASFSPNPTVVNPIITFQSGAGDYKITVTVTNSAGISSSQSITLTYINK